MMKVNQIVIKRVLLICFLGFYFSCAPESFPELPAETQAGKQTFGCLVNNELVFAEIKYQGGELGLVPYVNADAIYSTESDQLQINAQCQYGQQFVFLINKPYQIQDSVSIDTIQYLPPNFTEWIQATQVGSLHLTRMDSPGSGTGVVSGTFSFDLNENGKAPIHVTKGRFDLTLNTY